MKSAELNIKTQQANLLLDGDFQRFISIDPDLGDRSERPSKLKNEDLIAASKDTTKEIKDKVNEIDGVEIPSHVAYSPDYVPSDFSLFPSMRHFL
ncbi:hypothetical protein KIN20_004263 [Parelaphostrongylus tenuis]|uniref:Uncharacterized protein n=1 Tax=Parelaphostrongylus tenuis TaxID=148309 RepID=A0AAD5QEB7_PARTN|nr:hypothetical protein KIN20_004263 [Parelaphostrongylus tenuis]